MCVDLVAGGVVSGGESGLAVVTDARAQPVRESPQFRFRGEIVGGVHQNCRMDQWLLAWLSYARRLSARPERLTIASMVPYVPETICWRLKGYLRMDPQLLTMNQRHFRCNVIDDKGTVSVIAPPHGPKVIAAAIAMGSRTFSEIIRHARTFDAEWASLLHRGLLVFDEHNVDEVSPDFGNGRAFGNQGYPVAFRVIDAITRKHSLVPSDLGLMVFNLKERRIIQVHNSYDDLKRSDRGRVRINGEPTARLFHYELPADWVLVP